MRRLFCASDWGGGGGKASESTQPFSFFLSFFECRVFFRRYPKRRVRTGKIDRQKKKRESPTTLLLRCTGYSIYLPFPQKGTPFTVAAIAGIYKKRAVFDIRKKCGYFSNRRRYWFSAFLLPYLVWYNPNPTYL